jgi:hypothetical protein
VSNVADRPVSSHALRRGVLFGCIGGLAAGLVWYLVVLGTTSMQAYLIPAFGVVVSYSVFAGMRAPGRPAAIVSVVVTLVAIALSLFYVQRHLVVQWFSSVDDTAGIPLVPYLDWVVSVVGHAFGESPAALLYAVLALLVAGWFGYQGFDSHDSSRRPR